MSDLPYEDALDTEAPERTFGPTAPSRHTGECSICQGAYLAGVTPVIRTTWGRTVHPACLAPAFTRRRRCTA